MPLLATTLPLAAIMMTVAATLVRDGRGYVEPPTWSGTATVVLLIYSLLIVPYLLLLRKQASSHMGDRLRAKGMEPRAFLGLSGMVMFLSPTCVALFLSLLGAPLRPLYFATAFSIAGMVVWACLYWRRDGARLVG
jgi:hypothetical protein